MEARAVAERHCSSAHKEPWLDPLCPLIQWRHPAFNPPSFSLGLDPVRTRGDFTWPRGRPVDAGDRVLAPARSVYGEPRDRPPLRLREISSFRSRSECLGQRASPEALSAGGSSRTTEDCGQEAEPRLVAGADLGLAEAAISGRTGDADLPRNHLPKPLRSGSRRAQEGARRAPENAASDPALQEEPHSRPGAWPDCRCRLHPRAPCRGRGPRGSRALGGGPPSGFIQHAHRDAGRTPVSFHNAGEGQRQRHPDRREGSHQTSTAPACRAAEITDLGSRAGAGGAQGFFDRHGRQGLLLRPAEPVAARNEREHEPSSPPVFPEGHRPVRLLASGPKPHRSSVEPASTKDAGLPFPI